MERTFDSFNQLFTVADKIPHNQLNSAAIPSLKIHLRLNSFIKRIIPNEREFCKLFNNNFKILDGPDAPDIEIQELESELVLKILNASSDKVEWIQKYLPKAYKRLILSHNKHLNVGDYLIDDRTANGAGEFGGELLQYGVTHNIEDLKEVFLK